MKRKDRSKRQSVNAVSLFVTLVFLILAVHFSDGVGGLFAKKINKITENLDQAVLDLNENVTYSNYSDHSEYFSGTEFKAAGMAGLYKLTNMFIDDFTPADMLMAGLFSVQPNNRIIFNNFAASEIMRYYAQLVAVTIFLLVCVLLFPLCGLFFCCCRCCGNCGAKPLPSDKKKDTCKKIVYAVLLILCGTGLLFCIVCAFGSNQQLQDGIEKFPANMNNSIKDTKTFMGSTNEQVAHLLVDNYNEFSVAFNAIMTNSTNITMEQLVIYSNATAVSEIYEFTQNLGNIQTTLNSVKTDTNKLRVYASQLNDAIRKVRRDLTNSLNRCPTLSCEAMKERIARLQTSIDFNLVPDVTPSINSLNDLDIPDIQLAAEDAQRSLDSISVSIGEQLNEGLSTSREQIDKTRTLIGEQLKSLTETINQIKDQIDVNASPVINDAQTYIDDYGQYVYYVGLAISCILLLVTVCIIFGLICGICGKRPDGYGDNCCNKGAGGQFLICAVAIMFIIGFIISIVTLVSLIVGVVSEKAICEPFRDPNPKKHTVIRLVDSFQLNFGVDVVPSTLLKNCYENKSIYQTFNLQKKFDLDDIRKQFNITEQLNSFDIGSKFPGGFQLLKPGQLEKLEKLKSFNYDVDADKFADELQKNFTTYNLDELANALDAVISQETTPADIKPELELSRLHLVTYENKLIIPMKNLAVELVTTAEQLNKELKMNKNNFSEAITDLITEINEAQVALEVDAPKELERIGKEFIKVITKIVGGYVERVADHIQNEIGLCGPLNLVIHGTLTSTCDKIILPLNGFWFSLFWTIILYVITIFISVKLANLYRKHKPYDQYVETEYLYDAYADRGDNIPLNSRGVKRGKKKGKKSKRYEERPNVGREVARDYVAGSHPPDARYADMAPKHWEEFPNGGPPHYQRAPTEYERPPPYYYPGSGGEQ